MNNFDVGIIGSGVAGTFAALKIANEYKNIKTIMFDLGRPPAKRRRQIDGFLGCLPNSDGKIFQTDIDKVANITSLNKADSANIWFKNILEQICKFKIAKNPALKASLKNKLKNNDYKPTLNNYIQIFPKEIHALSKYIAQNIENKNISFSFDNEVTNIYKQKDYFSIITEKGEYFCKKIIIAIGRYGWRFSNQIFSSFGIIDNNDISRFGIRIETDSKVMKEFGNTTCSLVKNDIEIGPILWNGTIIPEDHTDMAISAFRSNEDRWKTDKVSFNLIKNCIFPGNGFEQTDRLGKLTFILTNDRILKEKVSYILSDKSKISIIPEFNWLKDAVNDLSSIIPDVLTKAYFHIPTIIPLAAKVSVSDELETEVEGMYLAGESANITGILSAVLTGLISADAICK